jgi:hypothetical protein
MAHSVAKVKWQVPPHRQMQMRRARQKRKHAQEKSHQEAKQIEI